MFYVSSGQIADWHDPRTSKMNKEINYQSRNIRIRYIESSRHAIYIYMGKGDIYFSKSLVLSSPDITI